MSNDSGSFPPEATFVFMGVSLAMVAWILWMVL